MIACLQGADQLLSAFNVATFKNQEDDKAFWNRLIPVTEQLPDEDEIKQVCSRWRSCMSSQGRAMSCVVASPFSCAMLSACRHMQGHGRCHYSEACSCRVLRNLIYSPCCTGRGLDAA